MIGQVMNSLFSLQTVIESGVKVKSIHSYYLSSHQKNRILYCFMKLKVSMKLKQKLCNCHWCSQSKPACSGIIPRHKANIAAASVALSFISAMRCWLFAVPCKVYYQSVTFSLLWLQQTVYVTFCVDSFFLRSELPMSLPQLLPVPPALLAKTISVTRGSSNTQFSTLHT